MYDTSLGGSLEGRNLKVVVAMVIYTKQFNFVNVVMFFSLVIVKFLGGII